MSTQPKPKPEPTTVYVETTSDCSEAEARRYALAGYTHHTTAGCTLAYAMAGQRVWVVEVMAE